MDRSSKYIKMCDCKEIQDGAPKARGDIYYILIHQENGSLGGNYLTTEEHFEYYDCDGFKYGQSCKGGVCWHKESRVTTEYYQDSYGGRRTKKILWLPRQDQLQEMRKEKTIIDLVWDFGLDVFGDNKEMKDVRIFYYDQFTSVEQLWLALVMKENFKKTWNGKKWSKNGQTD